MRPEANSQTSSRVGVVHLAFGSNISPEFHMVRALDALTSVTEVTAVSPLYRSTPVDADGGPFLNAAVAVHWPIAPSALGDLKVRLTAVEASLGRTPCTADEVSRARWAARTIDLDITLAGPLVAQYGSRAWQVPHPDITRFAHVAVPLAALAQGPHPVTGRRLAEIATGLASGARLEPVDVAGWRHQ
jgi:2-amino-4-hydroxy-6-hydroxymethyldihydropteridine diphosphokinase